jgi:hypothetical protein
VYRNLCSQAELEKNVDVCYGQEIRYVTLTIGDIPTARQILPVIPQTRGPYASRIVPTGRAETLVTTDGYTPGYLFLALGGPFVFIPSFHLSNTFPTRSGLLPVIPQTRGPYASRIVPTGRAETLVTTAAMVNISVGSPAVSVWP